MAKAKKGPLTVIDVEMADAPVQKFENAKFKCAHNSVEDPRSLKPHPENPNFHPKKQIDMYVEIIRFQGWRRPITVSKTTGFIVKGHGACLAAIQAGFTEVPVDYQDYDSFEAEIADLLADNELGAQSEQNNEKIKELMTDLLEDDFNIDITGFTADALADVMKPKVKKERKKPVDTTDDASGKAIAKFNLSISFFSQDDRAELYDELRERGFETKLI